MNQFVLFFLYILGILILVCLILWLLCSSIVYIIRTPQRRVEKRYRLLTENVLSRFDKFEIEHIYIAPQFQILVSNKALTDFSMIDLSSKMEKNAKDKDVDLEQIKYFNASDIMSVNLTEYITETTETSHSGSVYGVSGNNLFVGNQSGSSTSYTDRVTEYFELSLTLKDKIKPIWNIIFAANEREEAKKWKALFEIAIANALEFQEEYDGNNNLIDELERLNNLRESGAITKKEFEALKNKLLDTEI